MTEQLNDPRLFVRSVTDEGVIEGYVCIFGSPDQTDSYGTWWDRNQLPQMDLEYLPVPLRYEHGEDTIIGKDPIGKVLEVWIDNVGIRFKGVLDKAGKYFDRIVNEIRQGALGTSSGTLSYLAEFDDENRFVYWPLGELSLTASPAEDRIPHVALVRSKDGVQVRVNNPQLISIDNTQPTEDGPIGGGSAASDRERSQVAPIEIKTQPKQRSKRSMLTLEQLGVQPGAGIDEVLKALTDLLGQKAAEAMLDNLMGVQDDPAVDPNVDPNADPNAMPAMMSADGRSKKPVQPVAPVENADVAALRSELAEMRKKIETTPAEQPGDVRTDRVSVGDDLKYAGKTRSDLEFAYLVMRSQRITPSQDFLRHMGGVVADAMQKGELPVYTRSKIKGIRANEIAISTAAGGGDEWVTIDYAPDPWLKTRNETTLIDQLMAKGMMVKEVPQGAESVQIPTEGADPTVYTIAQNADLSSNRPPVNVATTRIGTGNVLLTPGELGAAVAWSDVFNEDSIVAVAPQYNYQTTTKLQETIVQLWINGDTDPSASTNINLIDGTPGTGLSTPYYIASNGALKYALVTGSSTSRDGGTLDENDYRLTLKLMTAPTRSRLAQLLFVIDVDTHSASLDIAAIKTDEVRRTNATITSGVLTNIYGIDVHQTGFMALANSSGKIPAAGGTLGRILCAYAPYWAMGWKRHITIETDRDILTGDNILVAKMRVGFKARGADAATASYNLTV